MDQAGRIYVACWGGGRSPRIVVYDAAGTFAHQWDVTRGLLPPLRMPSGIVIDAQGAVYVTDSSTTARTSCRRQADDGVW